MIEILSSAQGVFERGLIFGITVAAVYVASSIIKFDNLAIEGAFGLGGALTALFINWQSNPWLALLGAVGGGALSGIITGLLHTKLLLNNLISGIVVTTGAFSIMLKIAGSTMILHGKNTIFTAGVCSLVCQPLYLLLGLCCVLFVCIRWLLATEVGFLLQAVGDAPQTLTNLGKSVDGYKIAGLTLSNALAAVSGALFVQYTGYFSIWANVGVVLIGLTGMIIAQTISKHFGAALLIGSLAYQVIITLTFELHLDQDWNKLINALLIVGVIVAQQKCKQ